MDAPAYRPPAFVYGSAGGASVSQSPQSVAFHMQTPSAS